MKTLAKLVALWLVLSMPTAVLACGNQQQNARNPQNQQNPQNPQNPQNQQRQIASAQPTQNPVLAQGNANLRRNQRGTLLGVPGQ
jgi:ABC-type uncharacterized transport system auxiliary subunit